MKNEPSSKGSTLILGIPFFTTVMTKINVHVGILSMEFVRMKRHRTTILNPKPRCHTNQSKTPPLQNSAPRVPSTLPKRKPQEST
ncbi:hypothetical protein CR513_25323, partial [Mucuna pruriens]